MSYQGYKNYETWAVCLWIDNMEGDYLHWAERAEELLHDHEYDLAPDADAATVAAAQASSKNDAIYQLAEEMKDEYEDLAPRLEGLWADLLNAALSEVDWWEVAKTRFDE